MGFSKAAVAAVVALAGSIANAQDSFFEAPLPSWSQVFLPMADNNGLVMSPDNAVLYATSSDGTVGAMNPADGSVLWTYQPPGDGPFANNGEVSFSADGSALYYAVSEGETCKVVSLAHPSGNVNWMSEALTGACEGTPYGTSDGNNVFVISNSAGGTVGHFTVLDSSGSVFFTQEDAVGPYSPMGFHAEPFPGGNYPLGQFNTNSIAIWGYKPTFAATGGEDGGYFAFQMPPPTGIGTSRQVITLNAFPGVSWRATAPPVLAARGQQLHWFVTRSESRSWVNSDFATGPDGFWRFDRGVPPFRAASYSPGLDNLDSPSIICGGSADTQISCSDVADIATGPLWLTDVSPGFIYADPIFSTNGDRVYWADDAGFIRSVNPSTGEEYWSVPTNVPLQANTELSADGAYLYFADTTGNIVAWQVSEPTIPFGPLPSPTEPAPTEPSPTAPAPTTPTFTFTTIAPTNPPPTGSTNSSPDDTSSFQATWFFIHSGPCASADIPEATMRCTSGAFIELLEFSVDVNCVITSPSEMKCTGSSGISGETSAYSVIFTCTGGTQSASAILSEEQEDCLGGTPEPEAVWGHGILLELLCNEESLQIATCDPEGSSFSDNTCTVGFRCDSVCTERIYTIPEITASIANTDCPSESVPTEPNPPPNNPPPTNPPPTNPRPTNPPPTTDAECPSEESALVSCIDSQLSGTAASACLDCVVQGIQGLAPADTCAEVVGDICGVIGMCSCSTCDDEIAEFFDCLAGFSDAGCPLECDGVVPMDPDRDPPPLLVPPGPLLPNNPPPTNPRPTNPPPTTDAECPGCPLEWDGAVPMDPDRDPPPLVPPGPLLPGSSSAPINKVTTLAFVVIVASLAIWA